jgi:hypothetical protein
MKRGQVVGFLSGVACSAIIFFYIESGRVSPDAPRGPRMVLENSPSDSPVGGPPGVISVPGGVPRAPAAASGPEPASEASSAAAAEVKNADWEEQQAAPYKARLEMLRKIPGAAPLVDDILASMDREMAEGREVFSDDDLPVDETGIPYLDEGGADRMIRNPEIRAKMAKLNAIIEKAESEREPASAAE